MPLLVLLLPDGAGPVVQYTGICVGQKDLFECEKDKQMSTRIHILLSLLVYRWQMGSFLSPGVGCADFPEARTQG